MATYTVAKAKHATLGAGVADTVNVPANVSVEVYNRSAAGLIYFRTDGTAAVVGADDNYLAGPGEAVVIPDALVGSSVSLISATADAYSVTVVA